MSIALHCWSCCAVKLCAATQRRQARLERSHTRYRDNVTTTTTRLFHSNGSECLEKHLSKLAGWTIQFFLSVFFFFFFNHVRMNNRFSHKLLATVATLVLDRKGAPLSSRISTTCSCPLLAPQWSGVSPSCRKREADSMWIKEWDFKLCFLCLLSICHCHCNYELLLSWCVELRLHFKPSNLLHTQ